MRIVTVLGARPQFIKAATVSRSIRHHNQAEGVPRIREILVHTGQHYDHNMSQVFFDELGIPAPKHHLGVGSGRHGEMTGAMLRGVEAVLIQEQPDWVLVYGDTNSTLAGALAAAKIPVPIAHVEAGLRSFNRRMPEEINRVLTDHLSALLLAPTQIAVDNLAREGVQDGVHLVGDVMFDSFLYRGAQAAEHSTVLDRLDLKPSSYGLVTVHRAENTDDRERLRNIFAAFAQIATAEIPLIVLLHPRTRAALRDCQDVPLNPYVRLVAPVSYLDMVALETHARLILTDSGGVQKEAYLAGVPCVTLRDETEWTETVECGWNRLAGARVERIVALVEQALRQREQPRAPLYGDGRAAEKILNRVLLVPDSA